MLQNIPDVEIEWYQNCEVDVNEKCQRKCARGLRAGRTKECDLQRQ